jgi:hypothetical protein
MRRYVPAVVLAMSLATASLAGCAGGGTANSAAGNAAGPAGTSGPAQSAPAQSAAAGPVEVCAVMTAARASAIVGVTYTAANASANTCNYPTSAAPIPMSIFISAAGDGGWKTELATIQEGAGAPPVTFSGVGDQAAGGGNEFGVQSGKWIIDILGGDPLGNGTTFPKSTALAQAILSQLH